MLARRVQHRSRRSRFETERDLSRSWGLGEVFGGATESDVSHIARYTEEACTRILILFGVILLQTLVQFGACQVYFSVMKTVLSLVRPRDPMGLGAPWGFAPDSAFEQANETALQQALAQSRAEYLGEANFGGGGAGGGFGVRGGGEGFGGGGFGGPSFAGRGTGHRMAEADAGEDAALRQALELSEAEHMQQALRSSQPEEDPELQRAILASRFEEARRRQGTAGRS